MEEHSLRVRQTGLRPKAYPLLSQAAVLPGSDAGSEGVKAASNFVIQTVRPRVRFNAECMGLVIRNGLRFVQWRRTGNPVKEQDLIAVLGQMESPNTSPQAIELVASSF